VEWKIGYRRVRMDVLVGIRVVVVKWVITVNSIVCIRVGRIDSDGKRECVYGGIWDMMEYSEYGNRDDNVVAL
jgi:hypothetical protein